MLFNSQIFVLLFFPVVFLGYYGFHKCDAHKVAKGWLLLASLVFYAYQHASYLILLTGSIAVNYLIYLFFKRTEKDDQKIRLRKMILSAGIIGNLATIFYFKYYNFFINNVNSLFHTSLHTKKILLPLGISFFTFQQISFLIDTYRGECGEYDLLDYSLFVSFFPQLVAGPIVLHKDLIPQFSQKERFKIQEDRLIVGLRYFVIGLAKKLLIADRFGRIADAGYAAPSGWDSVSGALIILSYTLQIYYDFSGYSDMAIGLGKILGFDIPMNFDSPYKAASIAEFWKHWHMTMTRFFTQYVYIPLGGSRKGRFRTCLNVMIVFTLSGLWHGAAWTFVFWGMLHGVAQVFHRMFKEKIERLPRVIRGTVTFVFVNIAWVFFRAEGFRQAKDILKGLVFGGFQGVKDGRVAGLLTQFCGDSLNLLLVNMPGAETWLTPVTVICALLAIFCIVLYTFLGKSSHEIAKDLTVRKGSGICWGILFAITVLSLMKVSTFLYFNF